MVSFGLFKKKERVVEPPSEQSAVSLPQSESLSIQEAQELLSQMESAHLQTLSSRLSPIKASAEESLKSIGAMASDMEREKIKLEDLEQRYRSLVENSRKTVVTSLKREAAAELELPQSVNDVKKFRDKFESMLKRIGEVTGSHSKILNNFMKKQSSRMKEDFERLHDLLDQTKSFISEFEEKRAPIVKCGGLLNTASQKNSSLQSTSAAADQARREISSLQDELARTTSECDGIKSSPEFHAAESLAGKLASAQEQREELRASLLEQFSHLSRAFTKYSYGVSKETESRLNLMSSEPWKLLDMQDTSAYLSLIAEVRKSVESGKIQLKDSDKMVHYIDSVTKSLPDFQSRAKELNSEIDLLKSQDISVFSRAKALEKRIQDGTERISQGNENLAFLNRQNEERKAELGSLLSEASELVSSVCGKKYSVHC